MTNSDTIDIALSTAEVRGLSQSSTPEPGAGQLPSQAEAAIALRQQQSSRLRARRLLIGTSAMLAVVGAAAYWAWAPHTSANGLASHASAAVAATDSSAVPAQQALVRFKNPFDAEEVFEFPAGTTETEAHDAVAQILLDRALERRNPVAVTASTR